MIEAKGLTKYYGGIRATEDVSFQVNKGEIVGLLGPNGAGKSTTMKIITTYLHPTRGTASVGGLDVIQKPIEVRKLIGYLPEVLPLYMDMEVAEYLTFVGKARGLGGAKLQERLDWVKEKCGLRPMYRKVIRELSKGYKQRTALGQALIHDPEVVILDEPTTGLDPHQIIEIRQLIRELAQNKTVILSTHILTEAESIADRLVIISKGSVVGDGTVKELRQNAMPNERGRIAIKSTAEEGKQFLAGLEGISDVTVIDSAEGFTQFGFTSPAGEQRWRQVGQAVQDKGWALGELRDDPFTLEETFLALTKQAQDMGGAQ